MKIAALSGLTDVSKTQVLSKGLALSDLIKGEFIHELKQKFKDEFEDVIIADMRFILIPKEPTKEIKQEKGIVLEVRSADFIRLEQPSPDHLKDKVVVITTNRRGHLDKLLGD